MDTKRSIATVVALLVIVYFGWSAFARTKESEEIAPYRATLSGKHLCLPHKDTEGPQTLECAIGLKAESGEYYVLDFSQFPGDAPQLSTDQYMTASGTVTPIEMLSTDVWRKYPVKGIFSVTDGFTTGKGRIESASWEWQRTQLPNGKVVNAPVGGKFVLWLDGKGAMTSSTDCNRMGGSYTLGEGKLSFSAIYSTKMYCQGSLDGEYARELGLSDTYSVEEGILVLGLRDGGAMTFRIK